MIYSSPGARVCLLLSLYIVAIPGASLTKDSSRDEALLPWDITNLLDSKPSGRPGLSPISTVKLTITDPNNNPAEGHFPTNATCVKQWGNPGDDGPWGIGNLVNCTVDVVAGGSEQGEAGSWWFSTYQPVNETTGQPIDEPKPDPWHNFMAYIRREDGRGRVYDGTKLFTIYAVGGTLGGNLGGACGGSGACSWKLKDEMIPLRVEQSLVEG